MSRTLMRMCCDCNKDKVSIWAHVVLPACVALLVFLLLIVVLILWSRWRRQQYLRKKMDEAREKEVTTHVVFPNELDSGNACGLDTDSGTCAVLHKADVSLIPRNPLVLSSDSEKEMSVEAVERNQEGSEEEQSRMIEGFTSDTGRDTVEAEMRSRSDSDCSDGRPDSLDSPKIPDTASQHSLLQMEV